MRMGSVPAHTIGPKGLVPAGTGPIRAGMLACTPKRVSERGYPQQRVLLEPILMTQLKAPMDCRTFRKHHLAYLDDTLSGDQMALAQRHILLCDPCAAHDTMVRRSLMLARSMPTIEPSAAFQERLQARLAQCRQERLAQSEELALLDHAKRDHAQRNSVDRDGLVDSDAMILAVSQVPGRWRSPRALAALAASAVIGTMVWRGLTPVQAPLVAMQPVVASQPAQTAVQYVSPALLQAMATGNPVWPATVIIEEAPTNFVNVDYSMSLDGRQ